MSKIKIDKVVSTLPDPLVANTVYAVRSGTGFDLFISDSTGETAHSLNSSGGGSASYTNTQSDNSTLETNGTIYNLFESGTDWIIKRSIIDANGDVTRARATGTGNATTAWTDRLTLTYS